MKHTLQTALGLLNDVNQTLTDAGWDNFGLHGPGNIQGGFLHEIRALLNRWTETSHDYCVRRDCDNSPLTDPKCLTPIETPYDRQAGVQNSFIGHS